MTNRSSGPTFQQLVLELKGDRSYETISKAAGGNPKSRTIQSIVADGFTRMPRPDTIAGLSRALNVSQRELVLAAARTLGFEIEPENPNDLLLVGAGRLPHESQEMLKQMSREMQSWMEGRRGQPEEEPVNVVHLPKKRGEPNFHAMAANSEHRSEGKESAALFEAMGEESQDR